MPKKVLFISHNAGRTGASLMLLNILEWWKQNSDIPFEILLRESGQIKAEFSSLAPTYLYQGPGSISHVPSFIPKAQKIIERLTRQHQKNLLKDLQASEIGLIYSNTITNGDILETLAPLNCPTITHVHELNYWIEMSGEKNFEQVKKYSQHYIAASGAVKKNLVEKYSIPSSNIDVVHSFIPTNGITANSAGIRQKFGIPEDAFVIIGSGYETWRKGKDLFVQLAARVNENAPEIQAHFLWVGGKLEGEDYRNLLHDIQLLGLTERVHFTGEVNNPLDYFAAGDVFAMVSREDPFPLVSLEAASLEKPVLCFNGAGGMSEFVENDAGYIVPYLDLAEMTTKIINLAKDSAVRKQLGQRAAEKVHKHYDTQKGSRHIEAIVREKLQASESEIKG